MMMMVHDGRNCCFLLLSLLIAVLLMATCTTAIRPNNNNNGNLPYLRMEDLKDIPAGANWISLDEDSEFIPINPDFIAKLEKAQNNLKAKAKKNHSHRRTEEEQNQNDDFYNYNGDDQEQEEEDNNSYGQDENDVFNPYGVQPFVEGISEYDEYQQAWRMLGFMIDCHTPDDDQANSHSNSEDVTEDGCGRYLIWAAYVDLDYEGGGISEYQFWNRNSNSWDDTACQYAEGGGGGGSGDNKDDDDAEARCVKVDCHLDDTHYSVLGYFKHRSPDDWMEQLFKHEGICVWTEEEYAFMKNARKAWPGGCIDSGSTVPGGSDDEPLYYDIKPLQNGRITVALYTDSQCVMEYSSTTSVVEDVLGNFIVNNGGDSHDSGDEYDYDFSGESLEQSLERWDWAFDQWAICNTCVTYNIQNYDGGYYFQDDDDGGNRRKLGGEQDPDGDQWECYDDAGYTNVNQCMKFSAKTVMKTATFRDMTFARTVQNTIRETKLEGYYTQEENTRGYYFRRFLANFFFVIVFFVFFLGCCCYSIFYVYRTTKATNYDYKADIKDSLLVHKGTSS